MEEKRKYVSHMTSKEKSTLKYLVEFTEFTFVDYCYHRMSKRGISKRQVIRTLKHKNIIEYHFINNSHRALLRGKPDEYGRCVCVVVDFSKQNIVTAYYNKHTDEHDTLDLSIYDEHLDILEFVKKKGRRLNAN